MDHSGTPLPIERHLVEDGRALRAIARALLHDDHAADDVVQEAALTAVVRSARDDVASAAGWLRTLVRNFARRRLRAEERRSARERSAEAPVSFPTPDELVARGEITRRVVECALALGEPYRSTVLLRYFEEIPAAEIARRAGVPESTVRVRLMRALEQMRVQLDRDHDGRRDRWQAALVPWVQPAQIASTGAVAMLVASAVVAGALAIWIGSDASSSSQEVAAGRSDDRGAASTEPGRSLDPVATTRVDIEESDRVLLDEIRRAPLARLPAASLVGTLFAIDGNAAAGAEVRLIDAARGSLVHATSCGADGRFQFGALPFGARLRVVACRGRDAAVVERTVRPSTNDLGVILLEPGVALAGRVVGPDEMPVPGARVTISGSGTFATSDERGRFELAAVPIGLREVAVRAAGFVLLEPSVVDLRRRSEPIDLELRVGRGLPIEGTVRDDSGLPASDVQVFVRSDFLASGSATDSTDEAGRFRIDLATSDPVELSLEKEGWEEIESDFVRPGSAPLDLRVTRGSRLVVRVADAATRTPIELASVFVETQRLHGRRGAGARGWAARSGSGRMELARDSNGVLELLVVEREALFVHVSAPGFASMKAPLTGLAAGRRDEREIEFELERARPLVVRVTAAGDRRPLAGARVFAFHGTRSAAESADRFATRYSDATDPDGVRSDAACEAYSDERGIAALFALPAGVVHLRVESADHAPAWLDDVEIAADGTGRVFDVEVDEGRAIEGVVLDSEGASRAGEVVRLVSLAGERTDRVSASDGSFRFERLAPGRYDVRIHRRGSQEPFEIGGTLFTIDDRGNRGIRREPDARRIFDEAASSPVLVDLRSSRNARVELRRNPLLSGRAHGRVTLGGAAFAGADVHLYECRADGSIPRLNRHASATTDDDGRFELEGLAATHWMMEVTGPRNLARPELDGRLGVQGPFDLSDGTSSDLSFDLPVTTLRVLALDPSGRPLPGIPLSLQPIGGTERPVEGGDIQRRVVTDAEGRLEIPALPCRRYRITASHVEWSGGAIVDLTDGAISSDDVELRLEPRDCLRLVPEPGSPFDVASVRAVVTFLPEIPERGVGFDAILAREPDGAFWISLDLSRKTNPDHVRADGSFRIRIDVSTLPSGDEPPVRTSLELDGMLDSTRDSALGR